MEAENSSPSPDKAINIDYSLCKKTKPDPGDRNYAAHVKETPTSVSMDVVGTVKSPYQERHGTPRQPSRGDTEREAEIHLTVENAEHCIRGLEGFEFIWIIAYMHLNTGWRPTIKPPRGDKKQGVFATRSPHRPSMLSLSAVRLVKVDHAKGILTVKGVDLLDNTPVMDIKPYVPYCDAFPDAKAGWIDEVKEEGH